MVWSSSDPTSSSSSNSTSNSTTADNYDADADANVYSYNGERRRQMSTSLELSSEICPSQKTSESSSEGEFAFHSTLVSTNLTPFCSSLRLSYGIFLHSSQRESGSLR